jgi:uncharacterized protein
MDPSRGHAGSALGYSRALGRRTVGRLAYRALRMPLGHRAHTVTRMYAPMRDGVDLLTDVYLPEGTPRGTLLIRTPYGLTGPIALLTAGYYATHGYRVVHQACRGTSGSGGDFVPFVNEVADGADTVGWLRGQAWFDGRFALCGASYLGFTAWAVMMEPPPELVTAVIAISGYDIHLGAHGSGAFGLEEVVGLMDAFGHLGEGVGTTILRGLTAGRRLRPAFEELPLERAQETVLAGSRMPYREWLTATRADDALWRPMRLGQALERVDVPVLLQAGWQDRFPDQMIAQYERLRQRGVDVDLTIGPWTHVDVGTRGAGFVMAETLDWLEQHLAATGTRRRPSPVRIHVTGAREWQDLPAWPPATGERVLYLHAHGELGDGRPAAADGPTTFTFDPADPTPALGGRIINPSIGGHRDNRELEERADVVTFTSPPLTAPLVVMGNPVVEVVHATDNPHADLFVRLCDVQESGRSVNVSDGFQRLEPERATGTIRLRLEAVAHRFGPGSRIRLQVSGGAHPRYARNLGTDQDPATSTDLVPSRRTIFHGRGGVSRVLLPVPLSTTTAAVPPE